MRVVNACVCGWVIKCCVNNYMMGMCISMCDNYWKVCECYIKCLCMYVLCCMREYIWVSLHGCVLNSYALYYRCICYIMCNYEFIYVSI